MSDILYCEWLKLKRSKILVIGALGTLIVPILVIFNSLRGYFSPVDYSIDLFALYDTGILFLMLLFAPSVISVIAAYLISREYTEKTLKTILTVPVSRKSFLWGKFFMLFMVVMLFMILSWLAILVFACICGLFLPVGQLNALSAVYFLVKMLFGGILLYMTITPVVYISLRSKGFMAPLIAAAVICFLNVVLSGSQIAGFFPWTAVYFLVSRQGGNYGCPAWISFIITLLVCIISIAGSMRRFQKEGV